MNCQATRPERAPRVTDHSTASACRASGSIGRPMPAGVAVDHGEEGRLVAVVEAEPEAEAVGERDLLLGRLGRVDRGRALVLDHVARHQVAAVGGGVEQHVVRPALDAAVQHRFQRLVVGVLPLERQVVAQDQAAPCPAPRSTFSSSGRVRMSSRWISISARLPGCSRVGHGVGRLHQRGLAHPARAPQHGVVGRQAAGEAQRVLQQDAASGAPRPSAGRSSTRETRATGTRRALAAGCQTNASAASSVHRRRRGRGQTLQRLGDAGVRGRSVRSDPCGGISRLARRRGSLTKEGRKLWSAPSHRKDRTLR